MAQTPNEQYKEMQTQLMVAQMVREGIITPEQAQAALNKAPNAPAPVSGPATPPMAAGGMEPPSADAGPMGPPSPAVGGLPAPSSPPAAGAEGFYERLGPSGVEGLLGMKSLDKQMAYAEGLRDEEGPTGIGGVGSRNTYVAANPLSHLATAVNRHRGKKDVARLQEEEKEYIRKISGLLRDKVPAEPGIGSGFGVV